MESGMNPSAPAGQPGNPAANTVTNPQPATEQGGQNPVNYVTQDQLNAALEEMGKRIQSSTDKGVNRVSKMIAQLQQAGIQNVTEAQAEAVLKMQEQSVNQQEDQQATAEKPAANGMDPEAEAWIKNVGGDPSQDYWTDIYDAARESGVDIISQEDPEYKQYFLDETGLLKRFAKPRAFVRAFEQAFESKAKRLNNSQQPTGNGNLAAAPAIGAGGMKSKAVDNRAKSSDLLDAGILEMHFPKR